MSTQDGYAPVSTDATNTATATANLRGTDHDVHGTANNKNSNAGLFGNQDAGMPESNTTTLPSLLEEAKTKPKMTPKTKRSIAVMCALAFVLGFQPSEPFLTQYMTDNKGLNESQIDNQVYPCWTWSYFVMLIPAGM